MSDQEEKQRFLRFVRAIALVSGAAIPMGATLPACADDAQPQFVDAGLSVDGGIRVDAADAASDKPGLDVVGGPMMPPEFDERPV